MEIPAIPANLRTAFLNSALLRTRQRTAAQGFDVQACAFISGLPLFNADLQADLPMSALALRLRVAVADTRLRSSPESARGVTGAIKSLLDWLVSLETFVNEPAAGPKALPRAHQADEALRETLRPASTRRADD
jgi:NAD(P)H-dependent FMN reductase